MATKVVPWNVGNGNITLSYNGEGDGTISVSSDINNLDAEREQTIEITGAGLIRSVTVKQKSNATEVSATWHPTGYDESDHSYYSLENVSNAYTDSDSSSYATIHLTRGNNRSTYIFFTFDTSSIPEGAEIVSVSLKTKAYINNVASKRVVTHTMQAYSGSTAKGSATTVTNTATEFTMSIGTWTLQELRNIRIRLYATRGTQSTTSDYYFRFYGATLSVTYKVGGKYYITSEGDAYVTSDGNYYNCK